MTHSTNPQLLLPRGLTARLREPRRLAAIGLLALALGLVLAFIYARHELAGADAYAYWTAVQRWLAGEDIYQVLPGLYVPPSEGALPYAYAPWSLYVFLPWALLPWDIAWLLWRGANIAAFAVSVAWAYERRPLGTALMVALVAPALAANLDTGNVNVFIALGVWVGWFSGPRLGGLSWALGAALKWVPAPLLVFVPRRAWPSGLAIFGVLALLTLASWPEVVRQADIVANYPRPLRVDYMFLLWAIVPWLWTRPWPPRLSREWLRETAPVS